MKKIFILSIVVVSFMLAGCSLDNDDTRGAIDQNKTDISGNLTSDLTLLSGIDYKLTGGLIVKSGVTLTIQPAVTVRALAGGTGVFILVEKGGKIIANGTKVNPIRFTSNSLNPKPGDWGGIIINGKAPISRQSGTQSNAATEVNNIIFFGGNDASDNSGIMNYVIMEYTGARIDNRTEHNGLTLNGVGNGTKISNIAIINGDDDALEFFGGTVNASNILVVNAKDDMFDFSQGYTGTCENLYGIREANDLAVTSDPRGVEADGNLDGNSPTDINQSNFTINGLTIINKGAKVRMTDAIKIRRGATATITNAYIELGNEALFSDLINLDDPKGGANANTSITVVGNPANGLDITDIKNGPGARINVTNGTSGFINTSIFSWTGYSF